MVVVTTFFFLELQAITKAASHPPKMIRELVLSPGPCRLISPSDADLSCLLE